MTGSPGKAAARSAPPVPRRPGLLGWLLPGWADRNYALVFWARLAMSAGRSLAGVVVPVYLALQGFSAVELALWVLVVSATAAVFSSAIGLASDRVGRRPFLVALPLFTAAAALAFALFRTDGVLFVAAAIGSFGRGSGAGAGAVGPYQPAESALVTETVSSDARNAAFGRLAFASSIGALIGGGLATLAGNAHVHGAAALSAYRPAFLAIVAVSAVAGLLALGLEEPRRPPRPADPARRSRPGRVRLPRRSRWLLFRLWVTNGLNGIAVGMFGPFITYWLYRRYGVGPTEIGVLFAVINLATTVSTLSAAGLARRYGLVRTVVVFRILSGILLVPMVLAPTFALAGAVYLVRMVLQRVSLPLRQSYVLAMADPEERASVAALSNVPAQVAMTASPLLTGFLFEVVSLSLPFELSSIFFCLNGIFYWIFFRSRPPEEEVGRQAAGTPDGAAAEDTTTSTELLSSPEAPLRS